ncbi:MAG TPA: CHAD domain-containing protein [Gaiellaceae bacterium]
MDGGNRVVAAAEDAIRFRAFELSQAPGAGDPGENWLRAEQEFAVAHGYDTPDRDLEQAGMTIARLPSEAGVVWRLTLPRGERVEEWAAGNAGLTLPAGITRLVDTVVAGKPLVPGPLLSDEPGALRLREMIEAQRQSLVAHDPGTRLGDDPENLHQHRVAGRRTRAFLHTTRASLDPAWRRSLAAPLRELAGATGPVRDLDVVLEHVRDEIGLLAAADVPGGYALVARLERERAAMRTTLLAALDGDAYRHLLACLRLPPALAPGVERVRLERAARREFRRLAATVAGLGKHPDAEELHGLRGRLKRARYAAELAPPGGKARRRFIEDARVLQELLGTFQDAVIAEERLRAASVVDAATAAAFAAGRIAERQHARRDAVLRQLPRAWKHLRRSGARLD